jgi:Uma2 family endonuclease
METEVVFDLRLSALPVRLCTERPLTDDELLDFCSLNRDVRVERDGRGELHIMSPSGGEAGRRELEIASQLNSWAKIEGKGVALGATSGFRLRGLIMLAPDAAWVSYPSWNALSPAEKRGFPPLCPEFVIELRSPSDRLLELQAKMNEWIANGAELAWLIDPARQVVEVYRPGAAKPDVLEGVTSVMGEGPVAGFILELSPIWNPA